MTTMFEQADVKLPSDSEVEVVRSFRAPRALVYRAWTEPALVRQWMLGPPGWTMPSCEMDVRPSGGYAWRWRSEDGSQEFGFFGTYREVDPGRRLVHTEQFDPGSTGEPTSDGVAIVTVTFEGDADVTTVTTRMDFGTKATRDAAIATGMTSGMEQSYQLLDTLIAAGV